MSVLCQQYTSLIRLMDKVILKEQHSKHHQVTITTTSTVELAASKGLDSVKS